MVAAISLSILPVGKSVERAHSRVCTGGVVEGVAAARGSGCACGDGLAWSRWLGSLTVAAVPISGLESLRAWREVLDRKPQDCAIPGPAVKPTRAPASAPTGPNTTAPDSAPSAASPPRRSPANAIADITNSPSAANANVFFMTASIPAG
jgi:hypothetical protein